MGALTSLSPLPLQCIAETPTDTPPGSRRLASSSQASGAPPLDEVTVGTTRSFRLGGFGPEPLFLCNWLLPCASAGAEIASATTTHGTTIDRKDRKGRKAGTIDRKDCKGRKAGTIDRKDRKGRKAGTIDRKD